nr:sulfotransferase [uncultured Desulfobulbus sp.]
MIIAIGALGGSGTRAIAEVLIQSGVYFGDDLNSPNDNLIFTRLFKDPTFYKNASQHEINKRLFVFREYMGKNRLSFHNAGVLLRASLANQMYKNNKKLFLGIMRRWLSAPKKRELWGWKEPNTQIFLNEIYDYFDSLKYIHIVRHGLDMAFSNNKQQLVNWGFKYNISLNGNETTDEISYLQLEYWIRSTEDVLKKAKNLGNSFLLINHSKFCDHPEKEVDRILEFLNLKIEHTKLMQLYKIPKKTSTVGRFKKQNIAIFDKRQIDFVRQMGFEV